MTNIGHFRAAGKLLENTNKLPTRLWISPPTRMDKFQLEEEGFYKIYENAGVRTEIPGVARSVWETKQGLSLMQQ